MDDTIYYTYAWLREDGTPYYVGKGKNGRCRDRRRSHCPPEDRILILKNGLTEQEALAHEVYMISVLGRKDAGTGILRNLTDGGEGTSGVIRSPEWRAQHSAFMTVNNPMKGKKFPEQSERLRHNNPMDKEEAREKIRQARLNEKLECPYCGRTFNKGNFARHSPKCKANPCNSQSQISIS